MVEREPGSVMPLPPKGDLTGWADNIISLQRIDSQSSRPSFAIEDIGELSQTRLASLLNHLFDKIPHIAQPETEVQWRDGQFHCRMVFCPQPDEELAARRRHAASPAMAAAFDVRAIINLGERHGFYSRLNNARGVDRQLGEMTLAAANRYYLHYRWRKMDDDRVRALMSELERSTVGLIEGYECDGVSGAIKEMTGKGKHRRRVTVSPDLVVGDGPAYRGRPKDADIRDVIPLELTFDIPAHPAYVNGIVTAAAYFGTCSALPQPPALPAPKP